MVNTIKYDNLECIPQPAKPVQSQQNNVRTTIEQRSLNVVLTLFF